MAQTHEEPEFRPTTPTGERRFFAVLAMDVNEAMWDKEYGPLTPSALAEYLTFQFVGGQQQGVDVYTVAELTGDAFQIANKPIASNNG